MQYPQIDEQVWDIFCKLGAKCIPINGPVLRSEANEITMKYNFNNFTASNGWLKSLCARYQKFPVLMVNQLMP